MTTISTTAIGPPLEAEGTAAGGSRGWSRSASWRPWRRSRSPRPASTESDLEAGGWVRSALVVVWALAAIVLALRAAPALGGRGRRRGRRRGDLRRHGVLRRSRRGPHVAARPRPGRRPAPRAGAPRRAARAGQPAQPRRRRLRRRRRRPALAHGAGGSRPRRAGGRRGDRRRRSSSACPSAHQTYQRSAGLARQRLQLVGCAVAVIVEVALVVAALQRPRRLAQPRRRGRPRPPPRLVPLALAAGTSPRISRRVDRVLVHTVSATGLTAVVVAVYLVIVIGLGRTPDDTERNAARAVDAGRRRRRRSPTCPPASGWPRPPTGSSTASATRPTRCCAPGAAGSAGRSRWTSCCSSWPSRCARCSCCAGPRSGPARRGRLELAVSVPDRTAPPLLLGPEEQPVVTRAGVTGNAWLEVWLPAPARGPAAVAAPRRAGVALRRAARPARDRAGRRRRPLHRRGRPGAHRAGPPGRPRPPQRAARLRAAGEPREPEAGQRGPAASRARIVATGDAERRKIERNLHDGAQQHLVALAVNLRLTKDILADDPEAAAEMLDALGDAVKDTIQELRDLAHGIYPPLLMDAGLGRGAPGGGQPQPAGRERRRRRRRPLPERGGGGGVLLLPRGAAERRQARARRVRGDRAPRGRRRRCSSRSTDDGPGFDVAAATAGHGYVNMSDRLGRHRRHGRVAIRARRGSRDLGHHPAVVTDDEPQPDDDRAGSAAGPVVAIARSEVRSRWLGLVLIGLLAGVVGAVAISGIALARRTTTAYDRLGEATKVDDARGTCCATPSCVDEITDLPIVTDSWVGGIGIAKVEGENTFIGITAGPREPSRDHRSDRARGPPPAGLARSRRHRDRAARGLPARGRRAARARSSRSSSSAEADYFRFDTGFEGGEVHGPKAVRRGRRHGAAGRWRLHDAARLRERGRPRVAPRRVHRHELLRPPRGGAAGFDGVRRPPSRSWSATERCPPEADEFSVVDVSDTVDRGGRGRQHRRCSSAARSCSSRCPPPWSAASRSSKRSPGTTPPPRAPARSSRRWG